MNFNRVLILVPLFTLIGCGTGEHASKASSTTGSAAAQQSDAPAKLASTTNNPAMKAAAVKRAVVRNGSLTIRVPNVEEAEKKANAFVTKGGGFVASSESTDLTENAPTITLKVRYPADGFDTAIVFFESLGKRLGKKVSGEDVTAQLVDFDARMKIMRAQEDSFRVMLAKASDTSTAAEIQSRIMELRGQIESLSAQRSTMGDLAALSTIDLTLTGDTKGIAEIDDKGWVQETWNSSTALLGGLFKSLGVFVIFAVVLSPIWIPIAWFLRRSLRSVKRPVL